MSTDAGGRTLILGLGNTILGDDGVGILAARRAREVLGDSDVDVRESSLGGFALLDVMEGYGRLVVIDAARLNGLEPGEIRVCDVDSFQPTSHLVAGHEIDLPTALALADRLGRTRPRTVTVIAVGIGDDTTFSETRTPPVLDAIERAAVMAVDIAAEPE